MLVEYGPVSADVPRWNWPSAGLFERWKTDFLNLPESREFDVFLLGGFLETLAGKQETTPDIDIILLGPDKPNIIRKLIVEGTRLGIEKYHVFVDLLWFDQLPIYAESAQSRNVRMYLIADEWRVDGEIRKKYGAARQMDSGLWELKRAFPTAKQKKRIESGFTYCAPQKISSMDPQVAQTAVVNINFPPFTHTLKTVLNCPWLLSANPVIAGGFPTAIYHVLQSIQSAEDWAVFEKQISSGSSRDIAKLHGDIDCYFHEKDQLWKGGDFHGLVSEQVDVPFEAGLKASGSVSNPWYKSFSNAATRSSTPIQCIKKPLESVVRCLESFDLVNCSIAWFDDRVYVHREFEDAFLSREVRTNMTGFSAVLRRDLYGRLFSANRCFKYASRYGFTLSSELGNFIQSLSDTTSRYRDLEDPGTVKQLCKDHPTTNPKNVSWLAAVLGRFRSNLEDYENVSSR